MFTTKIEKPIVDCSEINVEGSLEVNASVGKRCTITVKSGELAMNPPNQGRMFFGSTVVRGNNNTINSGNTQSSSKPQNSQNGEGGGDLTLWQGIGEFAVVSVAGCLKSKGLIGARSKITISGDSAEFESIGEGAEISSQHGEITITGPIGKGAEISSQHGNITITGPIGEGAEISSKFGSINQCDPLSSNANRNM